MPEKKHGSPRATGHCLCGAVRYQVFGPLRDVTNCHCGQCRRSHGHVAAYTRARREHLVLVLVQDQDLRWYRPTDPGDRAARGFCRVCGASLFWQLPDADTVSITAGTLDPPTGLTTSTEIFVEDAGDYYVAPGGGCWQPGGK